MFLFHGDIDDFIKKFIALKWVHESVVILEKFSIVLKYENSHNFREYVTSQLGERS